MRRGTFYAYAVASILYLIKDKREEVPDEWLYIYSYEKLFTSI